MSEKAPVNLFKKLLEVRKNISSVKKSGYNSHGNYHYPTEQDINESVRDLLNLHGVLIFTSSKITDIRPSLRVKNGSTEHSGFITSVETVNTFVDAESGEQFTVTSVGQGHDTLGDKGSNKAVTSCFKYLLSKNFLIETNDDPERDSTNTPKPSYQASKVKTQKSATPVNSNFGSSTKKEVSAPVKESKVSGFGSKKQEVPQQSLAPKPEELKSSGFGGNAVKPVKSDTSIKEVPDVLY